MHSWEFLRIPRNSQKTGNSIGKGYLHNWEFLRTLKNEVPLKMEEAEKILDTDSVRSTDESVSILSQSQVSFPAQLERENALYVIPANLENDTLVASSPRKNVSGYHSVVFVA